MSKNNLQPYIAYIVPASLYTIWQTSIGWLNTSWTILKLGESNAATLYIMFFLAHALSALYFAFWLEKPRPQNKLRTSAMASTFLTFLFTLLMAYSDGLSFTLNCLFSAIAAGFIAAYLIAYLLFNIRPGRRGIAIGLSVAIGVAVQFVVFTLLLPQQEIMVLLEKTILAAGIMLLSGILILLLPPCRNCFWQLDKDKNGEQESKPSTVKNYSIQIILFAILLCFFISYGMHDLAGTALWAKGENNLVFTWLFVIAGFIIAGIFWDSKGPRTTLGISFGLLSLGFIGMALQYKGSLSYVGFTGVQTASAFFGVSAKLLYLDVAKYYKKPVVVASLGLIFPIILKQAGVISANAVYKSYGDMSVFLGSLVLIMAAIPLIVLFFKKTNELNALEAHGNLPIIDIPAENVASTDLGAVPVDE